MGIISNWEFCTKNEIFIESRLSLSARLSSKSSKQILLKFDRYKIYTEYNESIIVTNVIKRILILRVNLNFNLENNNPSASCNVLKKRVCYRKYNYICIYSTCKNFKDSIFYCEFSKRKENFLINSIVMRSMHYKKDIKQTKFVF